MEAEIGGQQPLGLIAPLRNIQPQESIVALPQDRQLSQVMIAHARGVDPAQLHGEPPFHICFSTPRHQPYRPIFDGEVHEPHRTRLLAAALLLVFFGVAVAQGARKRRQPERNARQTHLDPRSVSPQLCPVRGLNRKLGNRPRPSKMINDQTDPPTHLMAVCLAFTRGWAPTAPKSAKPHPAQDPG